MSSVTSIKRWKNNRQQPKEIVISAEERSMNKPGNSSFPKKAIGSINMKAKLGGNPNQPNKNTRFLLGGSSRDPLNLNSLSDERIAKAINAVTPQSSPLPTPKHRKAEYKIEVLIPPNISDPLNLMNADALEDGEYESKLLSPVLAKKRKKAVDLHEPNIGVGNTNPIGTTASTLASSVPGGKKFRGGKKNHNHNHNRKRQRSAKQSQDSRDAKPLDVNSQSDIVSGSTDTLNQTELERECFPQNQDIGKEETTSLIDAGTANPDIAEANPIAEVSVEISNSEQITVAENLSEIGTTTIQPEVKDQVVVPPKAQYKFPYPPRRPIPFSWKKYRKNQYRKPTGPTGAEIVSPVVQTPPQTSHGGYPPNAANFRGPRAYYRGSKLGGNRRTSLGSKASNLSNPNLSKKQFSTSPSKVKIEEHKKEGKPDKKLFQYGNYNRYYGYRNTEHGKDPRLSYLNPEWFSGKDVLDIGCNVGHVTLAIAKNLNPRSVLGIDIDENLIRAAKQNVKHYTSCIMPKQTPKYSASGAGIHTGQTPLNTPLYSGSCTTPSRTPSYPGWDTIENVCVLQPNITSAEEENILPSKQPDKNDLFPICMPILFGPIDPTNPSLIPGSVRDSEHANRDAQCSGGQGSIASSTALAFPQNVRFACSNYVLESDDLLDAIQPEYDTILCLSTTKWMHLNFGDEGIKRAFKRMYAQLRYGKNLHTYYIFAPLINFYLAQFQAAK